MPSGGARPPAARRRSRSARASRPTVTGSRPPGETDGSGRPVDELLAAGAREALGPVLAGLPAACRLAVVLRDQVGLGGPEVADILELPAAAVTALLHRGRMALREAVTRRLAVAPALR